MGRPAGSKNKSSLLRNWIGGPNDPAKYLIEIMTSAGADPRERLQAAVTLMPYVHRKQPVEVEGELNATGGFTVRIIREWDKPALEAPSSTGAGQPEALQCVAGTPEVWQDSAGAVRLDRQGI